MATPRQARLGPPLLCIPFHHFLYACMRVSPMHVSAMHVSCHASCAAAQQAVQLGSTRPGLTWGAAVLALGKFGLGCGWSAEGTSRGRLLVLAAVSSTKGGSAQRPVRRCPPSSGIVEFSNVCENDCGYCGIRKHQRRARRCAGGGGVSIKGVINCIVNCGCKS